MQLTNHVALHPDPHATAPIPESHPQTPAFTRKCPHNQGGSRQSFFDHMPMNIGQPTIPTTRANHLPIRLVAAQNVENNQHPIILIRGEDHSPLANAEAPLLLSALQLLGLEFRERLDEAIESRYNSRSILLRALYEYCGQRQVRA